MIKHCRHHQHTFSAVEVSSDQSLWLSVDVAKCPLLLPWGVCMLHRKGATGWDTNVAE